MQRIKEEKKEILEKLRRELLILKTLNIKPNCSELHRLYNIDRRTIKKYYNGYEKPKQRETKTSEISKIREEIKEKLTIPGTTIAGVYEYFKEDYKIGTYSNFYKYVQKEKLKPNKNNKVHLRYETEYGKQLQFDWKEDIKLLSKYGEIFEFNIFSATLGASRLHVFIYSKTKTRLDVQRCLVKTFEYIQGVPEEILTDNMSSIVNNQTHNFNKEFIAFTKDMQTTPKKCKIRHPYTKGKDESANRFINWLLPYNHEFEDEEELIKIIENINYKVNRKVNATTGASPIMLYNKEKEYLKPLPNKKILNEYLTQSIQTKISNESLFYYKGKRYSVPIQFINKTLDIQENNNKLYVYYNKKLITIHNISEKNINYKEEHYIEGLQSILNNKPQLEIENMAKKNLDRLNKLCEVQKNE